MPKDYFNPSTSETGEEQAWLLTVRARDRVSPYIVDFRRWLYLGRPPTAEIENPATRALLQPAGRHQLVLALFRLSAQARDEVLGHSLGEYLRTGIRVFFEFLDEQASKGARNITSVSDIDRPLMQAFVVHVKRLKRRNGKGQISSKSANSIYKSAKSLLRRFVDREMLAADVFPPNPFPGASGEVNENNLPYSVQEMGRILEALNKDLARIRAGTFPVKSAHYSVGIYFALIALYTGINTTSLAELRRSGIQPNPLGDNWILLTTIKRRKGERVKIERRTMGNAAPVPTTDGTRPQHIDRTVHRLLTEVITLSRDARDQAPQELKDFVFIYVDRTALGRGRVKRFEAHLSRSMRSIIERHDLKDDHGNPLVLRVSRFRKTQGERVFLQTNDVRQASKALSNSPRVFGSHYSPVTMEMERNFAFVGIALEAFARNKIDDEHYINSLADKLGLTRPATAQLLKGHWNTGVGRCSDPLTGRFAPKNGTPCTKFLHCFRCPNMVVLGHPDDLYRLFSFYYFLVHERLRIGAKGWKKAYRHVIRIIDDHIAPEFPEKLVADARKRAQKNPHKLWAWRHYEGKS